MTAQEFNAFVAAWKSRGLRQIALAARLGCKPSSVTEWMQGKRAIPHRYEERIALIQQQWRDGLPAMAAALQEEINETAAVLGGIQWLGLRGHDVRPALTNIETVQTTLQERLRFLEGGRS